MRNEVCYIIVFLLLVFSPSYSISFGSLIPTKEASAKPGEKIYFEVLFWNLGEPLYLSVTPVNIPEGWNILIEPKTFFMEKQTLAKPPFGRSQYINLPGVGTIEPFKVLIEVKTPNSASKGDYTLLFTAKASSFKNGISVNQEKDFSFKINVISPSQVIKKEVFENSDSVLIEKKDGNTSIALNSEENKNYIQNITKSTPNQEIINKTEQNPLTGLVSLIPFKTSYILKLLLIIFCIGIISLVIYKYA